MDMLGMMNEPLSPEITKATTETQECKTSDTNILLHVEEDTEISIDNPFKSITNNDDKKSENIENQSVSSNEDGNVLADKETDIITSIIDNRELKMELLPDNSKQKEQEQEQDQELDFKIKYYELLTHFEKLKNENQKLVSENETMKKQMQGTVEILNKTNKEHEEELKRARTESKFENDVNAPDSNVGILHKEIKTLKGENWILNENVEALTQTLRRKEESLMEALQAAEESFGNADEKVNWKHSKQMYRLETRVRALERDKEILKIEVQQLRGQKKVLDRLDVATLKELENVLLKSCVAVKDAIYARLNCAICLLSHRSFVAAPCGHSFCAACMNKIKTHCPMCKTQIMSKIQMF